MTLFLWGMRDVFRFRRWGIVGVCSFCKFIMGEQVRYVGIITIKFQEIFGISLFNRL